MPRRNLARRFEPRYGVNQQMLDEEVKWVQRELEDRQVLSINDLRRNLSQVQTQAKATEDVLSTIFRGLPDQERLALKSMLARDIFHIAKLYETFLRSMSGVGTKAIEPKPMPEELDEEDEPRPPLVFKQSLFE